MGMPKKFIKKTCQHCSGEFVADRKSRVFCSVGCHLANHNEQQKLGTEAFIRRARSVHGDKYDYSQVRYRRSDSHVTIICPEHGAFSQMAKSHLNGRRCHKCGKRVQDEIRRSSLAEFVEHSRARHGNKYDYSEFVYVDSKTKGTIICPEHGQFLQTPNSHLATNGCRKCGKAEMAAANTLTNAEFIERARAVHGWRYAYDRVDYKGRDSVVMITCPEHGDFTQRAWNHLQGNRCPKCASSCAELIIEEVLKGNNVEYVWQWSTPECRNKVALRFDFYLPQLNTLLEYHGEQHYRPIEYFGGKETFDLVSKRDQIKSSYASRSGRRLIVIPYTVPRWKLPDYVMDRIAEGANGFADRVQKCGS